MCNRLLILLALSFTGCYQTTPPQEIIDGWTSVPYVASSGIDREKLELELREMIFRREVAKPIRDEIVYISFGYADDENWIEPSDGFIDRLNDLTAVKIRSVSDANLVYGGFTSKSDGRIGHIYYVQIIEWIDDNTVKLNHALYGGPLYGGGTRGAVYEYADGEWRLKPVSYTHLTLPTKA